MPFALVALLTAFAAAAAPGPAPVVHHPVPKDPAYVSKDLYPSLKKSLKPPPQPGSAAQKQDEKTLTYFQKSRDEYDCNAAKSEVLVSLASLFGKPRGPLEAAQVERFAPFFEQVRNDADYFIQRLKKDFPRKRPFLYVKGLTPCVPREVTGAYPSGHATLSKLFALILADLKAGNSKELDARAIEVGKHRVLSGMHHPTDVEAGRMLAVLIHEELKNSPKYQEDFNRISK